MRCLCLMTTIVAVAVAKPELYKETEDFQFSRSSTDEGTKSGFYGAQRGNMGGNYERAHNMDGLAQHQMSGLVRQVHGELGDGSQTRAGSVYTAANSRGMFGSGQYDLGNLEGRNFQESSSLGSNSQSLSRMSSHDTGFTHQSSSHHDSSNSQLRNQRYNDYTGDTSYGMSNNYVRSSDRLHGSNAYNYGRKQDQNYEHFAQSANEEQRAYEQSSSNVRSSSGFGSKAQTRMTGGTAVPVRVVIRPGSQIAIPVAAQTYDSTQKGSAFDQNSINSETETLNNQDQVIETRPSQSGKHYESSYSYKKEWEKHDTKPTAVLLSVPTMKPFSRNTELYDDTQQVQGVNNGDQTNTFDINSNKEHTGHYSGYIQTANDGQRTYDQSSSNVQSSSGFGSKAQTRMIGTAVPVRIVIRPGGRIAIPIAAQTYENTQKGSSFDQNSIHSETETSNNQDLVVETRPSQSGKHYESSYSYKNEWEKHDTKPATVPLPIPTVKPFPRNSELYEDTQQVQGVNNGYQTNTFDINSNNGHREYHSNQNTVSASQSKHQSYQQSLASATTGNSFTRDHANNRDLGSPYDQVANIENRPKSYQSSYSYHKSWERQGDPYIIKPASNNANEQASQRLTAEAANRDAYTSMNQAFNSRHSYQGYTQTQDDNCEDDNIKSRKARSANYNSGEYDVEQQSSNLWGNIESLYQQNQDQWQNFENLGQETQNLQQQTQSKWENIEDMGQQTQNMYDSVYLGQQAQNMWKSKDMGQTIQNERKQFRQEYFEDIEKKASKPESTPNQHLFVYGYPDSLVNSEQKEVIGQSESKSWDSRYNENEKVIPVWEQSDDDNQRNTNEDLFLSSSPHHQNVNNWKAERGLNSNNYEHGHVSTTINNSNSNSLPSISSLQDLWSKIDTMGKGTSVLLNNEEINDTSIRTNFEQSYQNWQQNQPYFQSSNLSNLELDLSKKNQVTTTNNLISNSSAGMSSLQDVWSIMNNSTKDPSVILNNETNYDTNIKNIEANFEESHQNWIKNQSDSHLNNLSTLYENPNSMVWQGPIPVGDDFIIKSTTENLKVMDNKKFNEIERGDIGLEEADLSEKDQTTDLKKKQLNTIKPGESLSSIHESLAKNQESIYNNTTLFKQVQDFGDLSVLGTNEQKSKNITEEIEQSETNQQNIQVFEEQRNNNEQMYNYDQQSNQFDQQVYPKDLDENNNFKQFVVVDPFILGKSQEATTEKPVNALLENINTNQETVLNSGYQNHVDNQQNENIEQQNQFIFNYNLNHSGEVEVGNQYEDQKNEFDEGHDQFDWGQVSKDSGQELQSTFDLHSPQQHDIQIIESFKSNHIINESNTNFYEQQHQVRNYKQATQEIKNVDDKPVEVMVDEKPGFWSSVGNKFKNAKDNVVSWFKRS